MGKPFGTGVHSITKVFTQLTAAGLTAALKVTGMKNHTFQFVLANKDTNVVVEAQGSCDGTSFFPLTIDNTATATFAITANRVTITGDGNYHLRVQNTSLHSVKFNFVSEAGGAAATLDVTYYGQS